MAQPSFRAVFSNFRQPMPLPKKLWLAMRNGALRVKPPHDCCGHPGQPGCCEVHETKAG